MGKSDQSLKLKTRVRQGSLIFALLFNIFTTIEDVHFADDLVTVSSTHQHIQVEKSRLRTYAQQIARKISQEKSEVITINILNGADDQRRSTRVLHRSV